MLNELLIELVIRETFNFQTLLNGFQENQVPFSMVGKT
jgi:hypothetical protein